MWGALMCKLGRHRWTRATQSATGWFFGCGRCPVWMKQKPRKSGIYG